MVSYTTCMGLDVVTIAWIFYVEVLLAREMTVLDNYSVPHNKLDACHSNVINISFAVMM